jgi:uncharacterized membrane protein HdeD (DUF308 family)
MTEKSAALKTIWYFVGLVLMAMGILIIISGIIQLFSPPATQTVLAELHPALWWGGIMLITGVIYFLTNRNKTVE